MPGAALRQHVVSLLCYMLRLPFACFNIVERRLRRRAWREPRRIVLIKPCCLGDLLMTTPLLEVLRAAYPQAQITYVASSWSKVVPEHHPAVDAVLDCGTVGIPGRYRFSAYLRFARLLRRQRFDLAFVLDRSPMLTLLPWLAGIPRRVGPDSLGRGFSLTDRVPAPAALSDLRHQAELYLDLARALGLPQRRPHMRFVPTSEERLRARALLARDASREAEPRLQVALLPGGGSNPGMTLTAKRWPVARYRDLVQRLVSELEARVLLVGGPEDRAVNEEVLAGLAAPPGRVLNLAGETSFGELAAIFEQCALFIGNDSSPMHLATAVGIPVIALFGPTSPQEYGPYPLDEPHHVALWQHPRGEPCFFLGRMRACPECTCMQALSVDTVWQAVRQLLPSPERGGIR
ncbi:lipopolysaccharide heptosyltransferase II [Thermogemmatispora onikobensis]|uniref:lipopolysaccharide heptosyltransferase II n=1 Tax=Thermogemmatispora onikobensis TaxID=732234 RepID=UPI000853EE6D|nr:lipopolysaccharide heptosyltransferase II [Thermogemmatispora onikobensis]